MCIVSNRLDIHIIIMSARKHPSPPEVAPRKPPASASLGGRLAVDFVNSSPTRPSSSDPLGSWEGLVGFLAEMRVITSERARGLLEWERSAGGATQQLLRSAVRLRAAVREALLAMMDGSLIGEGAIAPINETLAITEGHDALVWENSSWRLAFRAREESLEWLLAAIARSAAEIITEGPPAPLRLCANPACRLIFYDTSRTGRRRWCSMATCGNRSKVAAFARRHSFPSRHTRRGS